MDHLLMGILYGAAAVLAVTAAGHALLTKRDPRSALGWITVSLLAPFAGALLYWSMGINRIPRRARQWQEKGRRLTGWQIFPPQGEEAMAQLLPRGAGHLTDLRDLGDRVVGIPLLAGNSVHPLHNGEGSYPAMLAAIDGATSSVHLSTYIFDMDMIGQRFSDALKRATARGVGVRVLVDGLGEKYSLPTVSSRLKGSGVRVEKFLPLRQGAYLNLRDHRKILVVDGTTAFTGGMNIGDRHLVGRMAGDFPVVDVHFRVEGPAVADLQRVFLDDWHFATGELLDDETLFPHQAADGTALVRVVADGPELETRKLEWVIMGALSSARDRVQIMTPYFIPDRSLLATLNITALRGVKVTLVLPEVNNLPFVSWASHAYLWELLQAGIRVYFQPPPFAHTKLFLVDGIWSLIGSANLDPRSLRLNFELNLEVYDRQFARTLERHFDDVVAKSREVFLADMDGRSLPVKMRDSFAKLFSPYL
jgi:cardiolipin synthase